MCADGSGVGKFVDNRAVFVGAKLGLLDGTSLGVRVENLLGANVGTTVGGTVTVVGDRVGGTDGSDDGLKVGICVGEAVCRKGRQQSEVLCRSGCRLKNATRTAQPRCPHQVNEWSDAERAFTNSHRWPSLCGSMHPETLKCHSNLVKLVGCHDGIEVGLRVGALVGRIVGARVWPADKPNAI